MKRYFVLFALLLSCSLASADTVTWTLNNVTFADGGTATGTFTFVDFQQNLSWNISVSGGNESIFPAFTYASADTGAFGQLLPGVILVKSSDGRSLVLALGSQSGSDIPIMADFHFSAECFNCNPSRFVTGGSIVSDGSFPVALEVPAVAPEPATLALLGLSLPLIYLRRTSRLR